MLFNTVSGEWDFAFLEEGRELDTPNGEVKLTVLAKTCDTVTLHCRYRKNEKIMTVSASNEGDFGDEANAYGFSFAFRVSP